MKERLHLDAMISLDIYYADRPESRLQHTEINGIIPIQCAGYWLKMRRNQVKVCSAYVVDFVAI